MRILVTGASGFIGGRLVGALLGLSQYEIVCAGRSLPKKTYFDMGRIRFLSGDLSDETFARQCTDGVEAIVHCAGLAGTWGPYELYRQANIDLTENLLKAARTNRVRRFINISSPSIYFEFKDQLNLKETDLPATFSNAYARTKYEAERLVAQFHGNGLETVSLRPRSVIGAGDNNVAPRIIRLQKAGALFRIGNGKNVVSVTSVSNLVDVIMHCLTAPSSAMGTVYNIANDEPVRLWDLVDQVLMEVGLPRVKKSLPRGLMMIAAGINEWICRLTRRKSEPALLPISVAVLSQSMTLNLDKAKKLLGYHPRQTTRAAIQEFTAWWTQQQRS